MLNDFEFDFQFCSILTSKLSYIWYYSTATKVAHNLYSDVSV